MAEASDVKGSQGDSASMQAITRVNVEQASKRVMRKPTWQKYREGRRHWGREREWHPVEKRKSPTGKP